MLGKILEVSDKNYVGGRKRIKLILLTIHNNDADTTNKNGIHWKEKYIKKYLTSLNGMGIFASFLDEDKRYPYDHGQTDTRVFDNKVDTMMEDSVQVGSVESGYIDEIEIDGKKQKVLIADGFISYQRYPNFVEYLRKEVRDKSILCSIEIVGLPENNNKILYEESEPSEDFRTPKEFSFSGVAILGVEAADENAYVLEVSQAKQAETILSKGETILNEETMRKVIEDTVSQCMNDSKSLNEKVKELQEKLDEKCTKVEELNAQLEEKCAEVETLNTQLKEKCEEVEPIRKELESLKNDKAVEAMEKALEEFTDDEKEIASEDIKAFKNDPMNNDVETIVNKILAGIGKAQVDAKKAGNVYTTEQNSRRQKADDLDIFTTIDSLSKISIF